MHNTVICSILHFIHRLAYPYYLPHAVTMNLKYFIICKNINIVFLVDNCSIKL